MILCLHVFFPPRVWDTCTKIWELSSYITPRTQYIHFLDGSLLWGLVWKVKGRVRVCSHDLKGGFHGSAHACILTGLCTLSGTGPGFSLFMNQSWASYLILHANSPKIINRRIYLLGQQINSTVHCVGKICWNPLRILVIRLLPRLTIASDYWTTSQCGFWSDNID